MTSRKETVNPPFDPAVFEALLPLNQELLAEQIRKTRAEADIAEIELASNLDAERDRLVRLGRIRHLRINDVINTKTGEQWLDALQHWERRDPGESVTVDINTPGGYVTEGLAIYDQIVKMRRGGMRVTTRAVGIAASMGAVILQAGDERVMDERAKLLIHEGSQVLQGSFTPGEQEDMQAFRNMIVGDILDIMADRSTLSRRQIQQRWKRKDWYLTATDALKYGFVDRIE